MQNYKEGGSSRQGRNGCRWPANGGDGSHEKCRLLEDLIGKDADVLALDGGGRAADVMLDCCAPRDDGVGCHGGVPW